MPLLWLSNPEGASGIRAATAAATMPTSPTTAAYLTESPPFPPAGEPAMNSCYVGVCPSPRRPKLRRRRGGRGGTALQGPQELKEVFLLRPGELLEALRDIVGLAPVAQDRVEDRRPAPSGGRLREHRVAGRSLGGPHEAREVVDVLEPVRLRPVVRLRHRVADRGHLVRLQPARDAHLVHVGIGGKRQQAGVL